MSRKRGALRTTPILTKSYDWGPGIGNRSGLLRGASVLVLDSDVLTLVQRGSGPAYEKLAARLDSSGEEAAVTVITLEEQMRGWLAYIAKRRSFNEQMAAYLKLHALVEDFSTRIILDFDTAAVFQADALVRQKLRIGTMDLKIAAIVLSTDSTLLTRNVVDFRRVSGLRIEDWSGS
jgi:tRNA(fMet)-specific endonuclease VapC